MSTAGANKSVPLQSWPPAAAQRMSFPSPTCASATTALRSFSMREGANSGSKATSVSASSTCGAWGGKEGEPAEGQKQGKEHLGVSRGGGS